MLGLIAVAFLSIAVHDRRSSSQYSLNTQADLLADGVVNMTQAAVGDDQPGVPRPLPGGTVRGQNCAPLSHPFLASRVPVRLSEIAPPWETAVRFAGADHPRTFFQGEYVFSDGSYWVCRQTHTASAAAQPGSQSPYWLDSQTPGETPVWPAVSRPYPSHQSVDFAAAPAPPFSARCVMQPAWVQLAGKTFPAFRFYHPATDRMQTIIAADADGDGVADAPLVPLPVGKLNGLDYFYAVRVVDHGSAVNASVAWQPNEGTDPTTAGGLFPTNVDLRQLLRGGPEEMNRLNRLRFTTSAVDPSFDLQSARIDDARNARSDFEFLSPQEALWMQLGRRLGNPWFTGAQPSAGARPKFTALPARESDVLAYKGGAILNGELPPSQIEQALLESTYASPAGQPWAATLRKTPYSAGSSIAEWFANFDYLTEAPDDPSTWKPRRALLTTRNPVSDLAPGLDMSPLAAAGEPPVVTSSGEPGKMPFTRSPSVASVNTAPFGELWRAFWNVMGEDWGTSRTPFGDRYAFLVAQSSAGKFDDPYVGTRFAAATFAPDPEQHPARMFRSPLRAVRDGKIGFDATTPRLNPDQVLLLRAALASVNTLALRAHGE
ncbi:MAG: hypothetical protein JWM97_2939, partial [Phycisphaerales bacterium]|nr:hypothetical protein [Phycisphaerales bacterium]